MSDEKLTEQVSALVDDELDRREQDLLLRRLENDPGLRGRMERFLLIGEMVRGSPPGAVATGFANSVAARIASEGMPAPPRRGRKLARGAAGLAAAASVAAIALLSLQPDEPVTQMESPTVVPVTESPRSPAARYAASPGTGWDRTRPEVAVQLNRYLLTHSDAAVVEPVEEADIEPAGETP